MNYANEGLTRYLGLALWLADKDQDPVPDVPGSAYGEAANDPEWLVAS